MKTVDDSEYVEIEIGGEIRESPCCPECGSETTDYVRYRSCPEHGVVLKAVERRIGYRPIGGGPAGD